MINYLRNSQSSFDFQKLQISWKVWQFWIFPMVIVCIGAYATKAFLPLIYVTKLVQEVSTVRRMSWSSTPPPNKWHILSLSRWLTALHQVYRDWHRAMQSLALMDIITSVRGWLSFICSSLCTIRTGSSGLTTNEQYGLKVNFLVANIVTGWLYLITHNVKNYYTLSWPENDNATILYRVVLSF